MRVRPGAGNDARFKKGGLSKHFLQQPVVLNVAPLFTSTDDRACYQGSDTYAVGQERNYGWDLYLHTHDQRIDCSPVLTS